MKEETSKHLSYIHPSTLDGIRVAFPVSDHVLELTKKRAKKRTWRSLFLRQSSTLAIVLILCGTSFSYASGAITGTISYFSDNEISQLNQFRAGLLGFRVDAEGTGYDFTDEQTGGALIISKPTPLTGSFPSEYMITVEQTGGSSAFCNALHLIATTTPFSYEGSLLSFGTTTTTTDPLQFGVLLPNSDGIATGDTCNVDLVYRSWSLGGSQGSGYTDENRIPLTFSYEMGGANWNDPKPEVLGTSVINENAPGTDTEATTSPATQESSLTQDLGDSIDTGSNSEQTETPEPDQTPPSSVPASTTIPSQDSTSQSSSPDSESSATP